MRKKKETTLVHPHAISEDIIKNWTKPLNLIYKNNHKPCYDQHPVNKRFEGWFVKI